MDEAADNDLILHIEVCLQVLGISTAWWKKLKKAFCVSRGSFVESDKCPQVMSHESASVGSEDY